jgi:hypothetical protein
MQVQFLWRDSWSGGNWLVGYQAVSNAKNYETAAFWMHLPFDGMLVLTNWFQPTPKRPVGG